MTSKRSLVCINSSLFQRMMMNYIKLIPSQQMLQYVSRDATLFIQSFVESFFRKLVKLCSGSALQTVLSWSSYKMASIMLSERCHLECVIRSPVLSQSVSVQCSVSLPKKEKNNKVSLTAVKSVVGVPRGCFGNIVRSRPYDF